MQTVHRISQFDKPTTRNRADNRPPPPPGTQTHRYRAARPPPWQSLRLCCLAMARRWHARRATGLLGR
jgi:hypothetical protein